MNGAGDLRDGIIQVVCELLSPYGLECPVIDDRDLAEFEALISGITASVSGELDRLADIIGCMPTAECAADQLRLIAAEYRLCDGR